ncbi:hypothetical protein FBQ96_06620, partial [Nitrospirales bacterium NOB]|nr:hypothetical protein [Nitrospirales bacterium NOB]
DALQHLGEKEVEIIALRLGLGKDSPQTLAAIGGRIGVTRERVRQIEAKALRRLRHRHLQPLSQLLRNSQEAVLYELATHQVIRDSDESQLFLQLDLESRLLVTVLYGSVHSWLDATCKTVQGGWLLPAISIEAYEIAQAWIADQLARVHLPCPQDAIMQGPTAPPSESIYAVLQLTRSVKLYGDYLLPARSTRRAQRAVRLHNLMRAKRQSSWMFAELRDAYLGRYHDDPCSSRDLLIVLSDNPQLFLNQYEMGWYAIGISPHDGEYNRPSIPSDDELLNTQIDGIEAEVECESESLRGALSQILLERGPQTITELRRQIGGLPGHPYSKASVGPILISHDEFVRIGPGLYALRCHLGDAPLLEESQHQLLNKAQLETFCRAMWAGESPTSYILWTTKMQVRWADWAQEEGRDELLSSLLAVADLRTWPIKEGDRRRWERLRDRMSVYLLEDPPQPLIDRIPSIREFLSASIFAATVGRVSWMSINRATGYRVDDRHSVSCLALMIAAGIVDPAMHWQQEHRTRDRAWHVLAPLLDSAARDTLTRWPRIFVKTLRQDYESLLEPGWTADMSLESLFDALIQRSIADDANVAEVNTELSEYEILRQQLMDDLALDRLRKRVKL